MDADGIIKLGPAGEFSGKLFDDKGRTDIAQIFIWHDESRICGIQFQYVENENLVLGELHGATSTWTFDSVQLKYPSEYVTSISGHYSDYERCITELNICTNKIRYGSFGCTKYPYPRKDDLEFHFKMGLGHQFHGFYGSVADDGDDRLMSIGVYFKPATTLGALTGKRKANHCLSNDSDKANGRCSPSYGSD